MPANSYKPAGAALNWTEADIARMAEVTPEDVNAAKANFKRLAPRKVKDLLDAKPDGRSKPRRRP